MKTKISKWDAQLAIRLLARAIVKDYSKEHQLELIADVEKYLGNCNLPSAYDYFKEAKAK